MVSDTTTLIRHAAEVCRCRRHCSECCRNHVWREQLGLPATCPEGFTADNLPDPDVHRDEGVAAVPPAAWIGARHAVCDACDARGECFRHAEQKPCERNNRLALVIAVCHRGRWTDDCWPEKAEIDAMVAAGEMDGRRWEAKKVRGNDNDNGNDNGNGNGQRNEPVTMGARS